MLAGRRAPQRKDAIGTLAGVTRTDDGSIRDWPCDVEPLKFELHIANVELRSLSYPNG
jgi:hypothetical protein